MEITDSGLFIGEIETKPEFISIEQLLREGKSSPQKIEGVATSFEKDNGFIQGYFGIIMRDKHDKDKYIVAGNQFGIWSGDDEVIDRIISRMRATKGEIIRAKVTRYSARAYILNQLTIRDREFDFYRN